MSIDELILELQTRRVMHGGSTIVRTTWEGVVKEIDRENIYYTNRGEDDRWRGLWIDADNNSYKPKNAT